MSFPNDNVLIPALQDQVAPLNRGGFGFRDELPYQDADAFPPEPEFTPEEEEQMHAQYLARVAAEAANPAAA